MPNISDWAKDKPIVLAMIAIELAFDAEYCFECANQIKKGEGFIYRLPIPPLNEWLALYKNHYRIFDLFKDTFIDSRGLVESVKDLAGILSKGLRQMKKIGMKNIIEEYNKLNDEEKNQVEKEYQEAMKDLRKLSELQIQDIDSDINDEKDEEMENRIKNEMNKPGIIFLYQVFAPCFLLYKCLPGRLLREARKGNIKYIEKLIRLDRSIVHDKKISEFLHRKKNNKMICDKINSAISNGINEKVTRKRMKMNIAGLISYVTMKAGRKFKESEIKQLFDAIAKDKSKDDIIIDDDMPKLPNTFYKAIERERRKWENAFNNIRSFT